MLLNHGLESKAAVGTGKLKPPEGLHEGVMGSSLSCYEGRRTIPQLACGLLPFPGALLYASLFVLFVLVSLWVLVEPVQVTVEHPVLLAKTVSLLGLISLLIHLVMGSSRYSGTFTNLLVRVKLLAEGLAFILLAWPVVRLYNHLVMSLAVPYADSLLASWDRALGFDWLAYFEFFASKPTFLYVFDLSYTSLTPLSILAFTLLCAVASRQRIFLFLATFFFTGLVCSTIGMMFPAEAAVVWFEGAQIDLRHFDNRPGTYHIGHLERLRSDSAPTLNTGALPGLTTFPSFHTAAGIVLCRYFIGSRLFIPVAVYSSIMIASTPIFGAHYLVDLLAGGGVALSVIVSFELLTKRSDGFSPECM